MMNTTCNQTRNTRNADTRGTCDCTGSGGKVGIARNQVYLDKIFYDKEESSCPIIVPLIAQNPNFTQELRIGGPSRVNCGIGNCGGGCGGYTNCGGAGSNGCGGGGGCGGGNGGAGTGCSCFGNAGCANNCCGCGSCVGASCCGCGDFDLNCGTKFTITNSCVTINEIAPTQSGLLTADAVTVDGFAVSALGLRNGRYIADLSGIMPDITKCPCAPIDRHLCDGCGTCSPCGPTCGRDEHFFLAEASGPWAVSLTIVLEGTVSNGKQNRDFKLTLKTKNDKSGFFPLTVSGSSNFAMYCVEIPCQTNGISPSLLFDFHACGVLMNPTLTVDTAGTAACPESVSLILNSNLVLTPSIHLQVIRPTLFALQADEVPTCCDDLGQCAGIETCADGSQSCDAQNTRPQNSCKQSCDCQKHAQNSCGSPQPSIIACGSAQQPANAGGCLPSSAGIRSIACQCCDTNGYLF